MAPAIPAVATAIYRLGADFVNWYLDAGPPGYASGLGAGLAHGRSGAAPGPDRGRGRGTGTIVGDSRHTAGR